jgi:glycine/D-amino acid oxidase-like deaminating enzyme
MSKLYRVRGAGLPAAGDAAELVPGSNRAGGEAKPTSEQIRERKKRPDKDPRVMRGAKTRKAQAKRLVQYAKKLSTDGFRKDEVEKVRQLAEKYLTDDHGRYEPELQKALRQIDKALRPTFTKGGTQRFQTLVAEVGAKLADKREIAMPESDTSFWQMREIPLLNFNSTPKLPKKVDYVVIGSGLAGASAALGMLDAVKAGKDVAVLEMEDAPARQASGRNGGNFEAIAENFYGDYEGLTKERYDYLKQLYRGQRVPDEVLRREAQKEADFHIQWGKANGALLKSTIEKYGIDADFQPHGWVRIAEDAVEEAALKHEVAQLKEHHVNAEFWPAEKMREVLKIPAKFGGRVVPDNGNYHPGKYVDGAMKAAVDAGVKFYTKTKVTGIEPKPDGVVIHTNKGDIRAERVVVATNAFTSELFPELKAIQYYQSQIMNMEHVQDTIGGRTVTEAKGDLYYNFPKAARYTDEEGVERGMAHVGGGLDRPGKNPHQLRRSKAVLDLVKDKTDKRFPDTKGQPPSRVWTGPMAFTPDRFPVLGFLDRPAADAKNDDERLKSLNRIVITAGFNGYGGTQALQAGFVAAKMALTGQQTPEAPREMVSPQRFLQKQPLFDTTRDGKKH